MATAWTVRLVAAASPRVRRSRSICCAVDRRELRNGRRRRAAKTKAHGPGETEDRGEAAMRIAAGIHRIGAGLVNSYLLEESGEITIVDAGAPGYWNDLPNELAAMKRTLADVRALVLTTPTSITSFRGAAPERARRSRERPRARRQDGAR